MNQPPPGRGVGFTAGAPLCFLFRGRDRFSNTPH